MWHFVWNLSNNVEGEIVIQLIEFAAYRVLVGSHLIWRFQILSCRLIHISYFGVVVWWVSFFFFRVWSSSRIKLTAESQHDLQT